MIATIAPDYWIAPAFSGGSNCLEPMQIGSVKALGIQKPWAPAALLRPSGASRSRG